MRTLTTSLAAAALLLGSMALASAQTQQPGAAGLKAQVQNATPVIKQAACNGTTGGYGCGPGWVWNGYYRRCVRCW
jgi:hypothetical protein